MICSDIEEEPAAPTAPVPGAFAPPAPDTAEVTMAADDEHLVNVTSDNLLRSGATADDMPMPFVVASSSLLTYSRILLGWRSFLSFVYFSMSSCSLLAIKVSLSASSCRISLSNDNLFFCSSWWLETMPLAFSINSGGVLAWMPSSLSRVLRRPKESVIRLSICAFSCFSRFCSSALRFFSACMSASTRARNAGS